MPLKLRRGTNAERLTFTPSEGELIYITDTKLLYVGDGTTVGGNVISGSGGGTYTLPTASTTVLGGVKVDGTTVTIDGSGVISASSPMGGILTSNLNLNNNNITGVGNIQFSGNLSNGTLTFTNNVIKSSSTFIAPISGKELQVLLLGNSSNSLQTERFWNEDVEPIEKRYGLCNSLITGLTIDNLSSRGSVATPQAVISGDFLSVNRGYGHDGFGYVLSSLIAHIVDTANPVSPGSIPGGVAFATYGPSGQNVMFYDSNGRLGINTFPNSPVEVLDVGGNAYIRGEVRAVGFRGFLYGNDSSVIVDADNSVVSADVVTGGSVRLSTHSIHTTDSTTLTVVPATRFSSDVVVDGEITGHTIRATQFISDSVGVPELSSATDLKLSATTSVIITQSPLRLANLSTTERDSFIAVNGDMIYNTTINKLQGYQNGSWINLDGTP